MPKKNDVKGDKPEEPAVESTTLEAPPSLPPKTVKKKFAVKENTKDTHIVPKKNGVKGDKPELDAANALAATKNTRAMSKRITVKVYILRAETEEGDVQKQKLTTTKIKNRLIITNIIKNKPAVSKKIAVEFTNQQV